jgi:N-acetylmuramoyl-L-alanine amidase
MAQAIAQGIEAYMPPNTQSEVFTDMRVHWARDAVLRLKSQEIVDGVGRLFKPNRELTRAEWMTLLDRVFDLAQGPQPQPSGSPSSCASGNTSASTVTSAIYKNSEGCGKLPLPPTAFNDLTGHWASTALRKAVNEHIIEGYEDATLRPDQPITRAEVAATFQRLALPLKPDSAAGARVAATPRAKFLDLPADHWAAKSISTLQQAGWIEGISADSFMPEQRMTRAEAAALLDRYVQRRK